MPQARTKTARTAREVLRRRGLAIACGAALALGVYSAGTTDAFAKSSKPTVAIATVAGVGSVLVDAKGRTLYTLTNNGQAVPCTGSCAAIWPPLVVKAGSKPKGGKGVTGLGTTSSGHQVTHNSLPLHRFSGDSQAGQANGEGLNSFGGTWHVVKTTAASASSPASTTSAKSAS
ncbi:MAG TPA: hypothetical protein VEP49_13810 [Acidimicrobiia bacterium]|nr:hypothetical protein [Acidimicrobiia bacterium]